jgi:hypothetical protein
MKPLTKELRERREVYRNLNFRDEVVYSVRKDGIVQGHATGIIMEGGQHPITFAVGPMGNQRVRDEKRKNVHAVIRGDVTHTVWYSEESIVSDYWTPHFLQSRDGCRWVQVIYNPYKHKTFVSVEMDWDSPAPVFSPIFSAEKVVIRKEVWALVPIK